MKKLYELLTERDHYRKELDKKIEEMKQLEIEADFICDMLQDIGSGIQTLGYDPNKI